LAPYRYAIVEARFLAAALALIRERPAAMVCGERRRGTPPPLRRYRYLRRRGPDLGDNRNALLVTMPSNIVLLTGGRTREALTQPRVVDAPFSEDINENGARSAAGEPMNAITSSILLSGRARPTEVMGKVKFVWSPKSQCLAGQILATGDGMVLQ
jgi:hypothetical protein